VSKEERREKRKNKIETLFSFFMTKAKEKKRNGNHR